MTVSGESAKYHDADWASRIAEQLPEVEVLRLASASAGGVGSVRALRGQAPGPLVRDACDRVIAQLDGKNPAFVSGALAGAATAIHRARARQTIDVVWTGPESGIATSRLTAATVIGLVAEARREILLVSYATMTEPGLNAALAEAAGRGVEITLVTERNTDNPGYHGTDVPFPGLRAIRLHWPATQRASGASLHAKVIVVDDEIALVTSANLTSRAMEANLECGILVRGGPQPSAIRAHVNALWSRGQLRRSL
jgi:phosphatidylserine/phosphatidylglycerophosphate/cardiolipin synthase-like enzyme